MMASGLFTLEGPLCAKEAPGARTVTICPRCGRGTRRQTGVLSVALVCEARSVWLTDANAILVSSSLAQKIGTLPGVQLKEVGVRWEEGLHHSAGAEPVLLQLAASHSLSASAQSVEYEDCSCSSVRQISFTPLVVRRPDQNAAVWSLTENPEVLILIESLRNALTLADGDLEFAEVQIEAESSRAFASRP